MWQKFVTASCDRAPFFCDINKMRIKYPRAAEKMLHISAARDSSVADTISAA